MKRFRITTTIEVDALTARQIAAQIERDLNRGDGLYMRTGRGCVIEEIKPKKKKP